METGASLGSRGLCEKTKKSQPVPVPLDASLECRTLTMISEISGQGSPIPAEYVVYPGFDEYHVHRNTPHTFPPFVVFLGRLHAGVRALVKQQRVERCEVCCLVGSISQIPDLLPHNPNHPNSPPARLLEEGTHGEPANSPATPARRLPSLGGRKPLRWPGAPPAVRGMACFPAQKKKNNPSSKSHASLEIFLPPGDTRSFACFRSPRAAKTKRS